MRILVGSLWMIAIIAGADTAVISTDKQTGMSGLIIAFSACIGAVGTAGSVFILPMLKVFVDDRRLQAKLNAMINALENADERINDLESQAKESGRHRSRLEHRSKADRAHIEELTQSLEREIEKRTGMEIAMANNQNSINKHEKDIKIITDSKQGFPAVGTEEFRILHEEEIKRKIYKTEYQEGDESTRG